MREWGEILLVYISCIKQRFSAIQSDEFKLHLINIKNYWVHSLNNSPSILLLNSFWSKRFPRQRLRLIPMSILQRIRIHYITQLITILAAQQSQSIFHVKLMFILSVLILHVTAKLLIVIVLFLCHCIKMMHTQPPTIQKCQAKLLRPLA